MHSSHKHGLVFKLDYEKTFENINQDFLEELLRSRDFDPEFITMIRKITHGGYVCVKLNNIEGFFP
jgi:hypothetical protein